jgi:hypothetical protein
VTERIIFQAELKVKCDVIKWLFVVQYRDWFWTFVSMVMNLKILCKVEFLEFMSDC